MDVTAADSLVTETGDVVTVDGFGGLPWTYGPDADQRWAGSPMLAEDLAVDIRDLADRASAVDRFDERGIRFVLAASRLLGRDPAAPDGTGIA